MTIIVIITIDTQGYKSMPQESRLHEFCLPLLFWAHRKAVTKGRMLQNCKMVTIIWFSNIYNKLQPQTNSMFDTDNYVIANTSDICRKYMYTTN
jgi:hypothetical protein